MVKRYTIQLLMSLAKSIGANPNKFMGTRTNITFLGKGPTKNHLFQSPIAGLEGASEATLGPKDAIIGAVEDAMGFASAQKLNSIQTQALGINLENILKTYRPPPLPSASVAAIRPGIEGLRRFPRETHKFFGRPLKDKDFTEIDELVKRGRLPGAGIGETGTVDFGAAVIAKTGMSRAVARQILLQDTRLNLTDRAISTLKLSKDLGKGKMGSDPLDMMKLFYKPSSMRNYDEFLNAANIRPGMNAKDIATRILAEVELLPNIRYAEGGLAEILQVPTKKAAGGRIGFAEGEDWKSKIGGFFSNLGWEGTGEDLRRTKEQFKARNLTEGDEHLRYFKAMGLPHSDDFLKDLAKSWAMANTTRDKEEIWNKYKRWLEMENFERANIAEGGLAGILQVPTKKAKGGQLVKPGPGRPGYGGPQDWGQEAAAKEQGSANVPASNPYSDVAQRETRDLNWRNQGRADLEKVEEAFAPKDTRQKIDVTPIQSFKENKYLDKLGVGINRNKAYAAGLLSVEDVMEGSIKPDIYAGISGDNFNIEGQKTKDMTGLYGSAYMGPVNVQGSYEDVDGNINRNIGATTNLGGVDFGVDYNFENNPTFGASYNTDNFSGGLTYDGEPKAMFSFSKKLEPRPKILGKNYAKGGLAGILEV